MHSPLFPNDPLSLLIQAWLGAAMVLLVLWLIQLNQRNASLADVGWCAGLAGAVVWYAIHAEGDPGRRILVAVMVGSYAARLGSHIWRDRVMGRQEDTRYRRLRGLLGRYETAGMFLYFQAQAAAVVLFSWPPLIVMQNPRPTFSLWELCGLTVWAVAVIGEMIADRQLRAFRRQPWNRDRVYQDGLWRYSRHPNYFFEWLHWWSYVFMALALPAGNWAATLIGPVVMGLALVKITGIPWAEAQALATRGEAYRDYQRRTSAFIPWPPRAEP